jgi:hypothetical protein
VAAEEKVGFGRLVSGKWRMCLSNRHGEGVTFDCIVIGVGIRASPERLMLFEKIINVVHMLAPQSRIAFSRTPADTAEAAQRWIKRGD